MNLLQTRAAVGAVTLTPGERGALILRAPAASVGAGVRLAFDGPARDWSATGARSLVFTLRANGAHRLRFHIEHGRGTWTFFLVPRPGLTSRVVVNFADLVQRPPNASQPGYLVFGGGPQPVDLADVRALSVTFNQVSPEDKEVTLGEMTLGADPDDLAPAILDPRVVVDTWGQWTGERGKPRTENEIRAAWASEPATFAGFPGQTNETGADASGVVIAAPGGFFRVAEHGGRWWLIDPDGRPFFSAGCDCVGPNAAGPVGGREALFADLSGAEWRGTNKNNGAWSNPRWADFYNRNVRRRYEMASDDWHEPWSRQTAARLRAWGFNTIANWSDPALTGRGLLPYTTNIASLAPFCGHLPDVFAPDFAQKVRSLVEPEVAPYLGDRMLIGYFVGNEPHWTFGGHRHPFNDVWTSAEYPHTRERALAWVRETYGDDLGRVNAAWETTLASWEDLARPDALPDVRLGSNTLKRDADEFLGLTLGAFYDTCCREIRACDPDHLLLGGRFYTPAMADPYVRACRAFDVYSFNLYNWTAPKEAIARITTLSGRPVLIGEFHYGVEDRGLTASLVAVQSQRERGLAYRHFVEGAAALPQVVGAHWFQWVDQPVTGRFDGECYNIGLIDATDVPYEDFLAHVKETHARLYSVCRGDAPYAHPGDRPPAW